MTSDMQQEKQRMYELRSQIDSLKTTNSSLQREIRSLQDVINEQKVSAS